MHGEDFFQSLYMETYRGLYQYIRRVSRGNNVVEDILQETYFEAYKQQTTLMHHENPKGWLYKTGSLKLRNYMRRQDQQNVQLEMVTEIEDSKNYYTESEWMLELDKILPEDDRRLLWKYYMEGFTGSELSKQMGISEECIKVRIYRMKKKLQKKLQKDVRV